jgi:hypothetical protein
LVRVPLNRWLEQLPWNVRFGRMSGTWKRLAEWVFRRGRV